MEAKSKPDRYRDHAKRLRARAALCRHDEARHEFERMADEWEVMARDCEAAESS